MSQGQDFDFKERVRQATDIVDLLGSYMNLRRAGSKYKGLCPFHDDSDPSLQVDPTRQTWMCWVCNLGGDIFSFTMKKEGVDFFEALKMLADRAGLEMPRYGKQRPVQAGTEKTTLYKALDWAAQQFHQYLLEEPAAEPARHYLDERAISPESIQTFNIGYTPYERSWLIDRAKETEFGMPTLQACGLVGKWEDSGSHYDWFRGRVMFPIQDTENRVVAFGGRILPEIEQKIQQESQRKVGKYVNSPETKVFSKSNLLYGLNLIRNDVSKTRSLAVVEGYTDVVMAYQFGMRNMVAALGTAVNERHIRLMKRFADQVTLVLDGDEAGQRRTNEILELFVAAEMDMRVAVLPEGQDPCDFLIDNDTPAFERFLSSARDALEHKFAVETAGIDLINDTHRASQALQGILQTLAKRPASQLSAAGILREQQMLAKLARSFFVGESELRLQLKQLRSAGIRRPQPRRSEDEHPREEPVIFATLDKKETSLLELIVTEPTIAEQALQSVSPEQFSPGPLRALYEVICELHASGSDVDLNTLMVSIDQSSHKTLLVQLAHQGSEKATRIASSDLTIEQTLQDVVFAFDQELNNASRRQVLSRLEGSRLQDDQELEALNAIMQQKLQQSKTDRTRM